MEIVTKTVEELLGTGESPAPLLGAVPDRLGINLCSVDSVTWTRQDDGQLVNLIIHFEPDNGNKEEQ